MKIKLINMPFGTLMAPSIALEQLCVVLKRRFLGRISVDVHYASLDFARETGDLALYMYPHSDAGMLTGIGDWLFRQAAFPDAPDNTEEYFARFYFEDDAETRKIKSFILNMRGKISGFLDDIIERYKLLDADIAGFTLLFFQATASIALARRLKELRPEIITVIGGAACDGVMGEELARRLDCVDHVFSGPALVSFPQFVEVCLNGGAGKCRDKLIEGPDLDINENILPDYERFLGECAKSFPDKKLEPVLLFETSRGCWWGEKSACSFCGLNGTRMSCRAMEPDNAVKQIEHMHGYADRCSTFVAVDNIMPRDYVESVFPRIHPPEGARIRYEVRADLDENDIGILCRAGVNVVQPGIEALASESLKLMRKGTSAFSNIRFLKACSGHLVILEWNLLIGLPGEDERVWEKYLRDIPLLRHLPPPGGVFPVMFTRFSEYFENSAKYGLELEPHDFYGLTYPFDDVAVRNLAYHFVDRKGDSEKINGWVERLNKEVAAWRVRWLNSDGGVPARLCFKEGAAGVVYDSRGGSVVEHKIDGIDVEILRCLEKPVRSGEAGKKIGIEAGFEILKRLDFLARRGLLFEEDGKFLSLAG